MLNMIKKLKCRKCPYHLGYLKFNVSPCIDCRVNGGNNRPLTIVTIKDNKIEKLRRFFDPKSSSQVNVVYAKNLL